MTNHSTHTYSHMRTGSKTLDYHNLSFGDYLHGWCHMNYIFQEKILEVSRVIHFVYFFTLNAGLFCLKTKNNNKYFQTIASWKNDSHIGCIVAPPGHMSTVPLSPQSHPTHLLIRKRYTNNLIVKLNCVIKPFISSSCLKHLSL